MQEDRNFFSRTKSDGLQAWWHDSEGSTETYTTQLCLHSGYWNDPFMRFNNDKCRRQKSSCAILNQGKKLLRQFKAMTGFDCSELVHVVYQVRMAEPFCSAQVSAFGWIPLHQD